MKNKLFFTLFFLLTPTLLFGYGMPPLGLGATSFLDGGPLRLRPGWYWQEFTEYYHTDKLADACGNYLGNEKIPFNDFNTVAEGIYQTDKRLLFGGNLGFAAALSLTLYSRIKCNDLGITDSGSGIGEFYLGMYSQYDPIHYKGFTLVQRVEMNVIVPVGKNKEPKKIINPATAFVYITPYWAATLYVTQKWAFSWRLTYVWSAKNYKICLKPGSALIMNYTTEYHVAKNLWLGINGYFLHQLQENKTPNPTLLRKEKVIGIGPGFLWYIFGNIDFVMFGNLYFETHARNRTQGINCFIRLLKYFGQE